MGWGAARVEVGRQEAIAAAQARDSGGLYQVSDGGDDDMRQIVDKLTWQNLVIDYCDGQKKKKKKEYSNNFQISPNIQVKLSHPSDNGVTYWEGKD